MSLYPMNTLGATLLYTNQCSFKIHIPHQYNKTIQYKKIIQQLLPPPPPKKKPVPTHVIEENRTLHLIQLDFVIPLCTIGTLRKAILSSSKFTEARGMTLVTLRKTVSRYLIVFRGEVFIHKGGGVHWCGQIVFSGTGTCTHIHT